MSQESYSFEKQIGATNYKVGVHFNQSGQTFEEKVLRSVKNDLTFAAECGMMNMPQTGGLSERSSL